MVAKSRNLSILLAASIVASSFILSQARESDDFINPLEGNSFSLRGSVSNMLNSGNFLESYLEENYSHEQSRAKVNFELKTRSLNEKLVNLRPNWGNYYFDSTSSASLIFNGNNLKCEQFDRKQFLDMLFLYLPELYDFDSPVRFAPNHIVGAARLIFFIMKHRHELVLKKANDNTLKIRNIPAELFKLTYQTRDSKVELEFSVFFSSTDLKADSKSALPIQIMVDNRHNEDLIIIDYRSIEILSSDNNQQYYTAQLFRTSSGVQFDPFVFEPISGCSKALSPNVEEDLFKEYVRDTVKFSFRAEIEMKLPSSDDKSVSPNIVLIKTFVAYDAKLNSMVYDVLGSSVVADVRKISGIRKQIFNFNQNRMYHTVERVQNSDNYLDKILQVSRENILGESFDARTDTMQCVVAKIFADQVSTDAISIGKLLLGADKFVYLGKAQVREIDALVYEVSHADSAPFWLDQPVQYKTSSGEYKTRMPNSKRGDSKLNILAYFGARDKQHPLLLLELYQVDMINLSIFDKQTIHIYDFSWDLNYQAPNGEMIQDLFSMEDRCSNNLGKNQYPRIELMLENKDFVDFELDSSNKLEVPAVRALALQASLQETFKLPATMIFDIETKLFKNQQSVVSLMLLASFRVAEHYDVLAELTYIGRGEPYLLYRGEHVETRARSFQGCFFQAAHIRGANVYFGYDSIQQVCAIDLVPVAKKIVKNGKEMPPAFVIFEKDDDSGGSVSGMNMEIYRTNHVVDKFIDLGFAKRWLDSLAIQKNKLKLLGTEMVLKDVIDCSNSVEMSSMKFKIVGAYIDESSYKTSSKMQISNNSDQEESDKASKILQNDQIVGFGYSYDDKGKYTDNDLVKLMLPLRADAIELTQDQCETACLTDYDCKSYSVCIFAGKVQCLLSKISIKAPSIFEQVMKNINSKEIDLRIEEPRKDSTQKAQKVSTVKLVKYANCEIRGKNFLNLFRKPEQVRHIFTNRRVLPVDSENDCAELCFTRNIQLMRDETGSPMNKKLNSNHGQITNEEIIGLVDKHYDLARKVCKAFLYLNLMNVRGSDGELDSKLKERILPKDLDKLNSWTKGYCIVGDQTNDLEREELRQNKMLNENFEESIDNVKNIGISAKFNIHYLKYNYFYEKQHGIRLFNSPMTSQEMQAYKTVKILVKPDVPTILNSDSTQIKQSLESIISYIDYGFNIQETILANEAKCAKVCYLQSYGPWPACRSFDLSIELNNHNQYISRCYLNSLTLEEAYHNEQTIGALRLVDHDQVSDMQLQKWHYEPRKGIANDELEIVEDLQLYEMRKLYSKYGSLPIRIHTLGALCMAILGIVSGVILAFQIEARFLRKPKANVLIKEGGVEFANQVNSEGLIPDS